MVEEKIFLDFQQGKIDSLYKNMYGKLILYASRCLGEDASFMSEDCVQDAIFKTYQMRGELQSAATLKSYLYTCVHNQAVSILRKQMARDNYLEEQDEAYFQNSLIEQEVLELLFDSIQALPEKYRRLLNDKNACKVVPPFNPLELAALCPVVERVIAVDVERAG